MRSPRMLLIPRFDCRTLPDMHFSSVRLSLKESRLQRILWKLQLGVILLSCFAGYSQSSAYGEETKTVIDKKTSWTLEDVKKIALDHNPDLQSARANYEAAAKGIGIAISAYLPHLDLFAKGEQTTLPNPSAGSTAQIGSSLPYQMVTVSLNQTIFDFGKTLSQINSSRAISQASEQEAFSVSNAVELAVQKAFYEVQTSAQLVNVVKSGLAKFQETFKQTQVLVSTGVKPSFDLSQARVELAKAKLALIGAQNTYELAKISLLNLMGIQVEGPFELVETGTPAEFVGIKSENLDLSSLIVKALDARPEMKRRQFAVQAAKYDFSAEVANYLPAVSLEAWAGRYLPDYPPSLANSWGIALVGKWNLFEGLKTTFRSGQLSAIVTSREALVEKARASIIADVNRAFKDLIRSEQSMEVSTDALEAGRENFSLAQKRYSASVATILELLVAQTSLLDTEAIAVTARYGHETALATLRRVVNAPLKDSK